MSGQETTILGLKVLFTLAAIFLIVFYLVRPIIKTLRARPDFLDSLNRFDINTELEEEELQIPSEAEGPGREAIIETARGDSRRTAAMVSQWLKDKR